MTSGRVAEPGVEQVGILIIGAGPTGLGAATRLHQHGYDDWLLVEQAPGAGGLACTDVTPQGFLFDMGGHVTFSHWRYFDELLDAAVGAGPGAWHEHQRVSYVRLKGRWVPYPFQNNLAALGKDDQVECLAGLVEARAADAAARSPPADFGEWIARRLGSGIGGLFMRPYNQKVWACAPEAMACGWLGERVAQVDARRAIANVVHGRADAGWGPNATFRFPRRGGTGGVWRAVAARLPAARQRYGARVLRLDKDAKEATLEGGAVVRYERLLTTAPLDVTLEWLGRGDLAARLTHSSTHVIGVGLRGSCPHGSKCWLYFPEPDAPFYRATVFSNYAEANCPPAGARLPTLCTADGRPTGGGGGGGSSSNGCSSGGGGGGDNDNTTTTTSSNGNGGQQQQQQRGGAGGPYWSLMFEVSEGPGKPVAQAPVALGGGAWPAIVLETLAGAIATGLVAPTDEVVSLYHRRLEHGYPTPTLGRDAALGEALPWLRAHGIWSRGRFGSYKYEVGNQDHSLMLGVEAADAMLFGAAEATLHHPDAANGRRNEELAYSDGRRPALAPLAAAAAAAAGPSAAGGGGGGGGGSGGDRKAAQ